MGFPVRFDRQRMSDSEDSEELDKETIGKRVSKKLAEKVKNYSHSTGCNEYLEYLIF